MENYENILNILTVAKDARRLGRVEIMEGIALEPLMEQAKSFGLKTLTYEIDDRTDLLFSKDEEILKIALDLHTRPTDPTRCNITLGGFYNYPDCCVKYFVEKLEYKLVQRRKDKDFDLMTTTILDSNKDVLPYYMNTFPGACKFIFHQVCSYTECQKSIEMAKLYGELVKAYNPEIFEKMRQRNTMKVVLEDGKTVSFE